jgi:hypothetical protein
MKFTHQNFANWQKKALESQNRRATRTTPCPRINELMESMELDSTNVTYIYDGYGMSRIMLGHLRGGPQSASLVFSEVGEILTVTIVVKGGALATNSVLMGFDMSDSDYLTTDHVLLRALELIIETHGI